MLLYNQKFYNHFSSKITIMVALTCCRNLLITKLNFKYYKFKSIENDKLLRDIIISKKSMPNM